MKTLKEKIFDVGLIIVAIGLGAGFGTSLGKFAEYTGEKCSTNSSITVYRSQDDSLVGMFPNVKNIRRLASVLNFTDENGREHSYNLGDYHSLSLNYKTCTKN